MAMNKNIGPNLEEHQHQHPLLTLILHILPQASE